MKHCILAVLIGCSLAANAQTYTKSTLYNFPKNKGGPSTLIIDASGNLYGTSVDGGTHKSGTAFKVTPKAVLTTLYNFGAVANDGLFPSSSLVRDGKGNLYGATSSGGKYGYGTIFKITSANKETTLYSFTSSRGVDYFFPFPLTLDSAGNLYGYFFTDNYGSIFKLTTAGVFSTVYTFCSLSNCADGYYPMGSLIIDKSGNFYGTTMLGGADGLGTVFKLTPEFSESVLYSFTGVGNDGEYPTGKLTQDVSGNLYGTTSGGGDSAYGVLFVISVSEVESTLYSFCYGCSTWSGGPQGGLALDSSGNMYGTTVGDGSLFDGGGVFEVSATGVESAPFQGGPPRLTPGVVLDKSGNIYGTTVNGGPANNGSIFKLTKN